MKIVLFHQVLDVEVVLNITGKDFSLLLNVFHKFDNSFSVFTEVTSTWTLLEYSSIELIELIVNVSASDVSAVILLEDVHFRVGETAEESAEFRVSEVNEEHVTSIGSIEIILSENSVVKSDSCRLIYKSNNV